MDDTEKIIYLIATKLQQALDQADKHAPEGIDRVAIKRPKNMFSVFSATPEDYVWESGIPIMLIPFEKLRGEMFEMLPRHQSDE